MVSSLDIAFNGASGNGSRLNWDNLNTNGLVSGFEGVTQLLNFRVTGYMTLSVSGFVQIRGDFEFSSSADMQVTLAGGNITKTVSVTTIGFEDVTVFVGNGPCFTPYGGTDSNAVGLLLSDIDIAVALFDSTADDSSFYAISGRAESMQIRGLDLGDDFFSFDASGYRVEVNGGKNGSDPAAIEGFNCKVYLHVELEPHPLSRFRQR